MLVHDLKQPLMSLGINIELLHELAALSPALTAAVERANIASATRTRLLELVSDLEPMTADLKQSAKHLNDMIDSLRELVRGRDTGAAVASDPLPVVRHAMTVGQHITLTKRASIDYAGPQTLPHVKMSAMELTQVLINLVSNAAQAVVARGTPNGKVSIVAREDRASKMLELQIRDDGVGMAPDVLQRIGTPFFTTRAEGTGLGFAQCQRLVGTAGGRIQIESQPGIGTTVTVLLPIAA
jgi:signal transduction histidine kinase